MAISIDHNTYVITVPKADLTLVQATPTEIRELDIDWFRLQLKDLEDDPNGMTLPDTHVNYPPTSVGGVTLARVIVLLEPYTVTFEDGQYAVNLTGANSNIGDRVNVNQVSIRSANSAGLVQTSEIEFSTFQNGVWIDQANGAIGTVYPRGTALMPVNNFADAKIIAEYRGLTRLYILGGAVMGADALFNTFEIVGQSANLTILEISPEAEVQNCEIRECYVMGTLDGGSIIRECIVADLNYVNGVLHQCMLNPGVIHIGGDPNSSAHILDCYSGVPGHGTPIIDMNGDSAALGIRGYNGGIAIRNKTGNAAISVDINSGQIILEDTVVAGDIVIRGIGKLIDNSNGANVDADYLNSPTKNAEFAWQHAAALQLIANIDFLRNIEGGRWKIENNQMVFYAEDNTTEVARFNLYDTTGQPSSTDVFERTRV
jgi:hypothetical protein